MIYVTLFGISFGSALATIGYLKGDELSEVLGAITCICSSVYLILTYED